MVAARPAPPRAATAETAGERLAKPKALPPIKAPATAFFAIFKFLLSKLDCDTAKPVARTVPKAMVEGFTEDTIPELMNTPQSRALRYLFRIHFFILC